MKLNDIVEKIDARVRIWSNEKDKLVIAVDGYAGSGKTTVVDLVAKQNHNVLVVHLDDFIKHWKERKRLIDNAKDKSAVFEYDWYRYDDLKKLIRDFKIKDTGCVKYKTYDYDKNEFGDEKVFDLSKKILIVEGVFLFHPKHSIDKYWDKTIYFNTDFLKADQRRIRREKQIWGKNYIPETNRNNWTIYYKQAYKRYIKENKPQENKDLVIQV